MTELGSEWHTLDVAGVPGPRPWGPGARFTATGRGALHLALDALDVQRLWVPSFACPSFLRAVVGRVELCVYPDRPDEPFRWPDAAPEDGVLIHDPFGLRTRPARGPGRVIEDHTHAPFSAWARTSEADVCLASVRKVLPVADGAVAWSPAGRPLGEVGPADPDVQRAVATKWAGMAAKAAYLATGEGDKRRFRAWLAAGEGNLWAGRPTPMSTRSRRLLARADVARLRRARAVHHAHLVDAGLPGLVVGDAPAPSFAFVVFPTAAERDARRQALAARGIYASALWPLDDAVWDVSDADRSLAARSFAIPLDVRATRTHLDAVIEVLR
jgi:hypothetical protein